jgi:hypothetical protein
MRRTSTRSFLTAATLLVAACGGDAMEEAQPGGGMDTAAADGLACYIARGTMAEAQERPSPLSLTRLEVGDTDGLLCYGAPSARGREIMGGLVVFGQLERIGANEPTTLHLDGPADVGGVELAPGSYSIYAVPAADEWQIFLNSNWQRWGIPIDDGVRASEVGSFTATPEPMDEFVETLRYRWENGELLLEWENTRVRIPVTGV